MYKVPLQFPDLLRKNDICYNMYLGMRHVYRGKPMAPQVRSVELILAARIDITYLPSDLCDWDWSFQPFAAWHHRTRSPHPKVQGLKVSE